MYGDGAPEAWTLAACQPRTAVRRYVEGPWLPYQRALEAVIEGFEAVRYRMHADAEELGRRAAVEADD